MRGVIWLTLLFAAAVVAALTLGRNDGLVSLFYGGWRVDLSLNFFLVLLVAGCAVLYFALHSLHSLLSLPQRAREWRLAQRDRGAQALLREALMHLWSGRYARAQKATQRLLLLQTRNPELQADGSALSLAHLLAAEAAHKLQDRAQRQEQFDAALREAEQLGRDHQDAARLQAVSWALDDREPERALALLAELPAGTSRRTLALRQRLQAARLARQPLEALRAARLLAKHQGFAVGVAQSLMRSLCFELLDTARDADQLRNAWQQLEPAERRDPFVVARAAERIAGFGQAAEGRNWMRALWEDFARRADDERRVLAQALLSSLSGLGPDWLPRLEAAQLALPRDPWPPLVMAHALAELQLWGKARQLLETCAADARLPGTWRRRSLLRLAELAEQSGDSAARIDALTEAARLP
jgi:HemY protein